MKTITIVLFILLAVDIAVIAFIKYLNSQLSKNKRLIMSNPLLVAHAGKDVTSYLDKFLDVTNGKVYKILSTFSMALIVGLLIFTW